MTSMIHSTPPSTVNSPIDTNPGTISQGEAGAKREQALLAWCQESFTRARNSRARIERQWYLNLAFYRGRQNVQVMNTASVTNGFRLITPPAPPWRVRLVINKIRPIIRQQIAKLTAQKPSFAVVPATNEDEDYQAAKVGEQILEAAYFDQGIAKTLRSTVWWTSVAGTGFIKHYWNPSKEVPNSGENGENIRGDSCVENVLPFFIFVPDPLEPEIENQAWVIHAFTKSRNWVKQYYGVELSAKATVKATNDLLEDSFFDVTGVNRPTIEEQILCLEVWIKPGGHPQFPRGGVITVVGDKLAQVVEQYPYSHKEYPFIKFEDIPTGQFYGASVIEDLISPQREYNRTRSQIVENKNIIGKSKLIYQQGAIDPAMINSEPGGGIAYKPGFDPPQMVPAPPMPSYISEEVSRIAQDFEDISGQHEVSRGENPAGVTAATAISYLQEQDDTKLAYQIALIEDNMAKLGKQMLRFVVDYWDVGRLIKTAGKNEGWDAQFFKGNALRGNTDVRVEAGSALPSSKAARQAFLMDAFKMGAIPPEKFLELIDQRGVEKVIEDYKVDLNQIQRENSKMSEGMPCEVHDFDNHEMHIEYHNRYRKTQEYEMLGPEIQGLFMQHVQQHQMGIMVHMAGASQMQGQLAQDGAPPLPPGPVGAPPQGGPPAPEGGGLPNG